MEKCFIIERVSTGAGKFRLEFFGDMRFKDARAAEATAEKMAREQTRGGIQVSVRAVPLNLR